MDQGKNSKKPWRCVLPQCNFSNPHKLERVDFCRDHMWCEACLKHSVAKYGCRGVESGRQPPCGKQGCTAMHHPSLHTEENATCNFFTAMKFTVVPNQVEVEEEEEAVGEVPASTVEAFIKAREEWQALTVQYPG